MAQVAIQTVAHPSTNPLAALGEACTRKDEREVWRVSNELMFEMPHILAVQRRVVQLIDEAFGAQYEDGWWSQLGDDVSEYWASERDNHPERETFDLAVVKGFFEERRVAATVAVAKAIRAEAAQQADVASALDKAIEEPTVAEPIAPSEEWAAAERVDPPPVLSKVAPMDSARVFARERLTLYNKSHPGRNALGTYHYRGEWWQWNGVHYDLAPTQRISNSVFEFLDAARVGAGNDTARFLPKPDDATKLLKCLEPCCAIDDREASPKWFDERTDPAASQLMAFRNCLLELETGKTYSLTPELWLQEGVDYPYDPEAKCPNWVRFLNGILPDDPEAQATVEEQLGLGMTRFPGFEKGAMWIGEPRSGRGTLARIQELLVGPRGHVPLNIHTWNKTENSKEAMIGKRVGIFHDVRLKEAKTYGYSGHDPGGVEHQSMQALLEIISGDAQQWGQKYIKAWCGTPYIKIIYISNLPPNVNDAALLSRWIFLWFGVSYLGREDEELKRIILPSEIPGIANRCLTAYRRLRERRRFIQPASGKPLIDKLKRKLNPYWAFMEDYWEWDLTGPGVLVSDYAASFTTWCIANDRKDLVSIGSNASALIQKINEMPEWATLKSFQPHASKRRYHLKRKVHT
jgi:putative DNA primase/helicase